MRSEFLTAAQAELDEGFEYYESLQPDLGFRFVSEIKKAVSRIESHPKAWHPLGKNTKRCLVNGFPYGLIYQLREEFILVVAVANLHRKPGYWKDRL
ncbi:MAG: type II toxin-antitoxin system RelE/ParE family toxin [Campylobacterales bacterium]